MPPKPAKNSAGRAPISFQELVAEMVGEDLQAAERDELVRNSGYTVMSHYE